MINIFYPYEYTDSIYKIDFLKLYNNGFKGIIFDLDNTLISYCTFKIDERLKNFFETLYLIGFEICILSNNCKKRLKTLFKNINLKYIYNAHKPSIKNYIKAMNIMNTFSTTTIVIGDNIFTDIYGANKIKIKNILVKPINPKEKIYIMFIRKLENIILFFYKKNKIMNHRLGNIIIDSI